MENIIKIIDALAWPAAIIWLGYLFRSEIRQLLGRVSRLTYKGLEAKFEKDLAKVEAEARKTLPKAESTSHISEEPIYPSPYDEKYEQLLRISEQSPRAALLEAWIEVETVLNRVASGHGYPIFTKTQYRQVLEMLINKEKFPKTILPLFNDLRILRNEAVHVPEFIPKKSSTKRYLQLAVELALTFEKSLNKT